jgi:hypothetical protein
MLEDIRVGWSGLEEGLGRRVIERGKVLFEAHQRVREAARRGKIEQRVDPHIPPDVIGLYVLLPQVKL